jgi:hypothetical protein
MTSVRSQRLEALIGNDVAKTVDSAGFVDWLVLSDDGKSSRQFSRVILSRRNSGRRFPSPSSGRSCQRSITFGSGRESGSSAEPSVE